MIKSSAGESRCRSRPPGVSSGSALIRRGLQTEAELRDSDFSLQGLTSCLSSWVFFQLITSLCILALVFTPLLVQFICSVLSSCSCLIFQSNVSCFISGVLLLFCYLPFAAGVWIVVALLPGGEHETTTIADETLTAEALNSSPGSSNWNDASLVARAQTCPRPSDSLTWLISWKSVRTFVLCSRMDQTWPSGVLSELLDPVSWLQ